MAAPMKSIRVKIISPSTNDACWFLINRDTQPTIGDVEKRLADKYPHYDKQLGLYLDGCWLPSFESTQILRDNDTITLRYRIVLSNEEALQNGGSQHWQNRVPNTKISRKEYRHLVGHDTSRLRHCITSDSSVTSSVSPVAESTVAKVPDALMEVTVDGDVAETCDITSASDDPHMDPDESMKAQGDASPSADGQLPEDVAVAAAAAAAAAAMEQSVGENPAPGNSGEKQAVLYKIIKGGAKKGGDLLTDSLGYTYGRKRVTGVSTRWLCSRSRRQCSASVKQQGDEFVRAPKEHNHAGNPGAALLCETRAKAKQSGMNNLHGSSGKLVKEALEELNPSDDTPLPNVKYIQRSVNRARKKLRSHAAELQSESSKMAPVLEGFLEQETCLDDQIHIIFAKPLSPQQLAKAKVNAFHVAVCLR